jgi:two-component system chemotaxis response regulator CheY
MTSTIMIVDDSTMMLASLRDSLQGAGFIVVEASDGAAALDALQSGPQPDVIITDLNMPKMDGLEFIAQARTLDGSAFTPILVLTTESQQAKREEARRIGATGWLLKPVSSEDLTSVIRQLLPAA